MIVGICRIRFEAEWVNSLKEKRSAVKNIVEKTKNKFNVSIAEIDNQDTHRIIEIGFACVTNDRGHADSIIQNVINFIENITDAVIIDIQTEIL